MFLGCKFYKLNPIVDNLLKEILLSKRSIFLYRKEVKLDRETNLYFYVQDVLSKENLGHLITFYYDDLMPISQLDIKDKKIKINEIRVTRGPVKAFLYVKVPLDNYLAILSNKYVSSRVASIIRGVINLQGKAERRPLLPVNFAIKEKEQEIRMISEFEEVTEFLVERIRDYYVDWAWLKGSMLDQSEEYGKYVMDEYLSGQLRLLAVSYKGRIYYLYNDGRMFTKQADTSSDARLIYEATYLFDITKNLARVGAVKAE